MKSIDEVCVLESTTFPQISRNRWQSQMLTPLYIACNSQSRRSNARAHHLESWSDDKLYLLIIETKLELVL